LRAATLEPRLPLTRGICGEGRFALFIVDNRSGRTESRQPFGLAWLGLDSGATPRFLTYDEGEAADRIGYKISDSRVCGNWGQVNASPSR
jgi:hypothetical protein